MREPVSFHPQPRPLAADEYLYSIAQVIAATNDNSRTSFELYVRTLPDKRNYLIAAGLEQAIAYLREFRFDQDTLKWLADYPAGDTQKLLTPQMIERLRDFRFHGDVDAVPEGTVVGPNTPLLRIVGSHFEATLLEAALLAIVNHQTMIASKAARIVQAADGRPVLEFSLRRDAGIDAALGVARASYIAGCSGTSNLEAARICGIPTSGTMAHQYILKYGEDREQKAFEDWLKFSPTRRVLLIDTYDPVRGIDRAIAASKATGIPLAGVRLDSGELGSLSIIARSKLDAAGYKDAVVLASNDLDEYKISELLEAGALIDRFGVGTMLGVSADAPHLNAVFKLGAYQDQPHLAWVAVSKRSANKATDPGVHQVFREFDASGKILRDTLGLVGEGRPGQQLLSPVMRNGVLLAELPTLTEVRDYCAGQRQLLTDSMKSIYRTVAWPLVRSARLRQLREQSSGGAGELAA